MSVLPVNKSEFCFKLYQKIIFLEVVPDITVWYADLILEYASCLPFPSLVYQLEFKDTLSLRSI